MMRSLFAFIAILLISGIIVAQGIRLVDCDSDATNASFTHAIQTIGGTAFTGYYWGFGLNSNASGTCTLRTYYGGSCDQTDSTGLLIYPGGNISWHTYQPIAIDTFRCYKACSTDVVTWIISGR